MTTIKNVKQFSVPRNLRTDEKLPTAGDLLEETLEHAFPDVEPGVIVIVELVCGDAVSREHDPPGKFAAR